MSSTCGAASADKGRPSKWLLVALLWFVALLNYLDRQVIFSQFPLIQHDLHASSVQLGLISSVFLWVYGILSPFAGYIADRWGHARTILLSLLVWSAATWLTGHVSSIHEMLVSRVLMGISEAFYLPAALAMIVERHGPETRSLATGLHQSGLYVGTILGGGWGGWMGQHYGWRSSFTILGWIGVLYGLVLFFGLDRRHTLQGKVNLPGSWGAVLRAKGFLALAGAFAIVSIANWIIYTWLPVFLVERFALSLAQAGFTATFYIQAASFAGMFAWGALTDRVAMRNPGARVWVQIFGLALTAPLLFAMTTGNSLSPVIIWLVLIGLLRPAFDVNAMPVLRQLVPAGTTATGYGFLNLAGCIAGGFSATLAGYMRSTLGLAAAYQFASILLILGCVCLLFIARRCPLASDTRY
jgi:MFS transporter, Spinster family, sphingosine-1-phosphate transporter